MNKKVKIYDCFTFFNELDILKIRLEELYPVVDYFIIVEANKTHSGKDKGLILEKNIWRYKKYWDKVLYIKVEDMPKFNFFDKLIINLEKKTHGFLTRFIGSNFRLGKWKLENFQREQIRRGLKNCLKEDIIMVSDIDEIPKREKIKEAVRLLNNYKKIGFEQKFYFMFLNQRVIKRKWIGTKAVKFEYLKRRLKMNPQLIRLRKFHFILNRFHIKEDIQIIKNGGWHFNDIGKDTEIIEKIKNKAEADLLKGIEKLNDIKSLKKGIIKHLKFRLKKEKIDKNFPVEIVKNKEELIKKGLILK
jgi:beta-1,4-mannosyl-glycoprotein beta-1,4-N-acetylglucosaminyltransferase